MDPKKDRACTHRFHKKVEEEEGWKNIYIWVQATIGQASKEQKAKTISYIIKTRLSCYADLVPIYTLMVSFCNGTAKSVRLH